MQEIPVHHGSRMVKHFCYLDSALPRVTLSSGTAICLAMGQERRGAAPLLFEMGKGQIWVTMRHFVPAEEKPQAVQADQSLQSVIISSQ